jgi:hypothetical protein
MKEVADLRARLERMSADDFAREFPRPALVLRGSGKVGESFAQTAVIAGGASPLMRYNDRVAFLTKREGNPFPHMVSVGRALNNDVVIVLSTVSKLHGYFLCEGAAWSFIDHRSKNGTQLNDKAVKPSERQKLADGDRIRLGLELQAVFLSPRSLYDFLRRSSSGAAP